MNRVLKKAIEIAAEWRGLEFKGEVHAKYLVAVEDRRSRLYDVLNKMRPIICDSIAKEDLNDIDEVLKENK